MANSCEIPAHMKVNRNYITYNCNSAITYEIIKAAFIYARFTRHGKKEQIATVARGIGFRWRWSIDNNNRVIGKWLWSYLTDIEFDLKGNGSSSGFFYWKIEANAYVSNIITNTSCQPPTLFTGFFHTYGVRFCLRVVNPVVSVSHFNKFLAQFFCRKNASKIYISVPLTQDKSSQSVFLSYTPHKLVIKIRYPVSLPRPSITSHLIGNSCKFLVISGF